MAFKDELDHIAGSQVKKQEDMLSNEDIYKMLLNALYKSILDSIKEEVAKGNYHIEKERIFSSGLSISQAVSAKIPPHCPFIKTWAAYESDEDMIFFKDLYKLKEGFFTKDRVLLTPLGGKVYADLKKLAEKDGITISEPLEKITYHKALGSSNAIGSMYLRYSYDYK